MYDVTLKEVYPLVLLDIQAGLVPFLEGSPGVGKSALIKRLSQEMNCEVIDHRLSTIESTDLTGLPSNHEKYASYKPFEEFPIEGRDLPAGKDGWILFLDEFNSAKKDVMAASYKLLLDRMIGQNNLHEKVYIVLAGNKSSDKAIVNKIGSAARSRIVTYRIKVDPEEFLQEVAIPQKWDERVLAFLSWKPSYVHQFNPVIAGGDDSFECPRTWDMVQKRARLTPAGPIPDSHLPAYAGTISPAVANEFVQFTKVWGQIPSYEDIVNHGDKITVPTKPALLYATLTSLAMKIKLDDAMEITSFVRRVVALDQRIVFTRLAMQTLPALRTNKSFLPLLAELAKD